MLTCIRSLTVVHLRSHPRVLPSVPLYRSVLYHLYEHLSKVQLRLLSLGSSLQSLVQGYRCLLTHVMKGREMPCIALDGSYEDKASEFMENKHLEACICFSPATLQTLLVTDR